MRGTDPSWARRLRVAAIVLLVVFGVVACGRPFPVDPSGTLHRIRETGVIRVGASHHPPQIEHRDGAEPTGTEVDLIRDYADILGVGVEWTMNTEAELMEQLDAGDLDIVIAGLRADSPWAGTVSLTRPYAEELVGGSTIRRVVAVPAGENALLGDLERFLDERRTG